MKVTETVVVEADAPAVYAFLADLAEYPSWLPLVSQAEPEPVAMRENNPAWQVELTARVGLFARSKQLRMVRSKALRPRCIQFSRAELDRPGHARWVLDVSIESVSSGGSAVTMELEYGGSLWGGGVLEKVLADNIERGRQGLVDHFAAT